MSNIKINDVPQRVQYLATGGQTQFTVPFPFFQNNYIYVWLNGVQLFMGGAPGQYTVSGAGSPSGGLVTFNTPTILNDIVTIEGLMPIDRTSIYSATISNLTGSDLNGDFNREVVMLQQLNTTQKYLQLQYAPWAVISQDLEVTTDRYIPLLPPGYSWRKNMTNTAIEPVYIPDGGLAPNSADYWISSANSELPNAVDMHLLGDGLLKQSVVANVAIPDIAVLGTDYYGDGMTGYMEAPAGIKDINGNIVCQFATDATDADEWLVFFNGKNGDPASIAVDGVANDVQLDFYSKGLGQIAFNSEATTNQYSFFSGTNYQHQTVFSMPGTAATRIVTWQDAAGTVAYLSDVAGTVTSLTGTEHQIAVDGNYTDPQTGALVLSLPQDIDTSSDVVFNSLQLTQPLDSTFGGTGVNNGGNLLGYEGDISFIGAFTLQVTLTAPTSVQFPPSGLLATTADIPVSVLSVTGTPDQVLVDNTDPQNPILSLPQDIDTGADITFHSLTFSNYSTGGIVGTDTNNAAASGFVGQVVQASSALNTTSLSNGTPADVLFIDLDEGDWQVWANIGFFGQSTTVPILLEGWISTTSATNPGGQYTAYEQPNVAAPFNVAPIAFCVPTREIKVANGVTQRVYLGTLCGFSGGTMAGGGQLIARRMR